MSEMNQVQMKQFERAEALAQKQAELDAKNKDAARIHLLAMKTLLAQRPIN